MKNTSKTQSRSAEAISFFSLVFFVLLSSCGASIEKKPEVPMEIQEVNPKIVFLNYKALRSEGGIIEISVLNKILKDGRLKGGDSTDNTPGTGLIVIQLDTNEKTISLTNIENPLSRVVEAVGDNGELTMRKIELSEAEFSIRLQLNPNTEYIRIGIKDASSNKITSLLTTKINEL